MSEKQWTPEATEATANHFETIAKQIRGMVGKPSATGFYSRDAERFEEAANQLRHGAASLRRWEALKAWNEERRSEIKGSYAGYKDGLLRFNSEVKMEMARLEGEQPT